MKYGTAAAPAPAGRRGLIAVAVLAMLAMLVALAPASASAAKADGAVDIDVVKRSKAGKGLIKAKIRASKPADTSRDRKGTMLGLPVRNAKAGPSGKVKVGLKGSIVLKGKKARKGGKGKAKRKKAKRVKIKRVTLVSKGKTAIRGKLGKRNLTIFKSNRGLKSGTEGEMTVYSLEGKLGLNKRAAKQISRKLKLRGKQKLRGGAIGNVTSVFETKKPTPPPPPPPPPPDDYPYASECPVQAVEGMPPGTGGAPGEAGAPAPLPTLVAGQDVTGTTIEWGVKQSLRGYIAGVGSFVTLDGTTANPMGPSMGIPGSFFGFPVASGSYEAGGQPDGSDAKLISEANGTVIFCNTAHGFSYVVKNPTVVIDGDDSRIVADIGVNDAGEWHGFQRVDFATLELGSVTPLTEGPGDTVTWEDVPAKLTEDGVAAIGSESYHAGDELDPVTIRTTIDRPLRTACANLPTLGPPPSAPESVDFELDPLPDVSAAIETESGEIRWGFYGALRGQFQTHGAFHLFNGAEQSDDDMSGTGKFFSFPVSRAWYDAGEPLDPSDDRLIAESDAGVGMCNMAHGYGAMFMKPTVVIDGAGSRLVVNAYGFRESVWSGGRVDYATFTPNEPTTAGNTVTWTDMTDGAETGVSVISDATQPTLVSSGTVIDPISVEIELPAP